MTDKEQAMTEKGDQQLETKKSMGQMGEFQPVDQGDTIRLPRLVLVQGGQNNQLIREGVATDGDLMNSLSKEQYGRDIEIVPLVQKRSTRIRWKSRDDGGGMLCIARDGVHGEGDPGDSIDGNFCLRCPYANKRKPVDKMDSDWCSSNFEIIAMIRSTKEPIILTADSIKSADQGIRDMLGMARINAAKGLRMWQKSYVLRSVPGKSGEFNFFKFGCMPGNNNQPLPADEMESLSKQSQFFQASDVQGEAPVDPKPAAAEACDGVPKEW